MNVASAIADLASPDASVRAAAAAGLYRSGRAHAETAVAPWFANRDLAPLLFYPNPVVTVGVAVAAARFAAIRAAFGNPRLSEVPPDQDAMEFELHLAEGVSLDLLTSREPGGTGAIARFLEKFGEGIQQVEFRCRNVEQATALLEQEFQQSPIYPQVRAGADGTRVNFFLVCAQEGKVMIELYEAARD
jgi:hypothetical protein